MSDVLLNKKAIIERCVKQIRTYYALPSDKPFTEDYIRQDAIAVNLQRACELCIDMANYVIRKEKLGLPKDSAESFLLLVQAGIIDRELGRNLKGMVGFRNVLVHQYQELDLNLMIEVIEKHLEDLIDFAQVLVTRFTQKP